MTDFGLSQKVKHTFVKQPCDVYTLNVKAAIITAASEMAKYTDIATKEQTITELMNLYDLNEEQVGSLIGMSPTYVKSLIGYSVDFMDYSRAKVNYDSNKSEYDDIYNEIVERSLNNNMGKQM